MRMRESYKLRASITLLGLLIILTASSSLLIGNNSSHDYGNGTKLSENTELPIGTDGEFKIICIPFAKEDLISRFELKTNVSYTVGKTLIYTSLNISDLSFYSESIDFWYHNEPPVYMFYLEFLTERAVRGDFSDEVKKEIEIARKGEELQYLAELISWLDKNMSTEEMMRLSLEKYYEEIEFMLTNAYRYGMLVVLHDKILFKKPFWYYPPDYSERNIEENLLSARLEAEHYIKDLNEMRDYLEFLTERAVRGDFSDEVKKEIEIARKGEELQYLAELISWLDKNMSTEEMIIKVLDRIEKDVVYSDEALKRYGAYQMLYLLSRNETYYLTSCNPPLDPPPANTWYYVYNWRKADRVWVGCYSTSVPDTRYFLGEFCTSYYTTNFNYYWNLAKSGYCGVSGSQVNSIQVKFFHAASISGYNWSHDMIWEINKNSTREWSRYGVRYKTTDPPAGYYMFSDYNFVLYCCAPPRKYCNTHCGGCFACDDDATQHFIRGQP